MTDLVALLTRYGLCGKFRRAVIADRGWRPADHRTGDEGEWFERWESGFAEELAVAVAAWVELGRPGASKFVQSPKKKPTPKPPRSPN